MDTPPAKKLRAEKEADQAASMEVKTEEAEAESRGKAMAESLDAEEAEFEHDLRKAGYKGSTNVKDILASIWAHQFPELPAPEEAGLMERMDAEVRIMIKNILDE